jgi:glycosyltransferase involved in cell wall biosynthesis
MKKATRIFYMPNGYHSHFRVAQDYVRAISSEFQMVSHPSEADIAVIHDQPERYPEYLDKIPGLKGCQYLIGYSVFEGHILPKEVRAGIAEMDEIWTASAYCHRIFERYHDCVQYIPHIIERDLSFSEADRARVEKDIGYEAEAIYFLAITKLIDPRKNGQQIILEFHRLRERMPNARLIVKLGHDMEDLELVRALREMIPDPRIIYLIGSYTAAEINALYSLASVYVSAHHAEGWGLTMSDSFLFGVPVVATAYSGNLEFMNSENSYLVDYEERYIKAEDENGLFRRSMKWAYPKGSSLRKQLLRAFKEAGDRSNERMIRAMKSDAKKFEFSRVKRMVLGRIDAISRRLGRKRAA